MWKSGQIALICVLGAEVSAAEPAKFSWKAPEIGAGVFSDALGMLAQEREEYAESLAAYAVNRIVKEGASEASLEEGRRFMALSMQLAPRNRRAVVANYQLSRGVLPAKVEGGYEPAVLSKLLLTRASLLKEQGGPENLLLARAFIELAADLDPRNDDAVYASELQRLDHGRVHWQELTDGGAKVSGSERPERP
ncbi:hypothetical protein HNR46_002566 [Haloferula luteola]|uniref:Uncharacterized protein n=1 Tax=Haloferula luteola TaxID=595692 RepID=A0A840VHW3_9BACT|nr:hypothetical protein [Haloferula luteola]MBB5352321.1 hypothetical protein [Haloferula luteola]